MNAVRMQIEVVTDTAADSVLAEFHRELFRQYDLLMVDTSYGTSSGSTDHLRDHLELYMTENFSSTGLLFGSRDFTRVSVSSLEVTGTRFAADQDCRALREQIYAYMSAEPVEAALNEVLASVDRFNGLGLDLSEWGRRKAENESELQNALSSGEGEKEDGGEMAERWQQAETFARERGVSTEQLLDPYHGINSLMDQPILRQVLPDGTGGISRSGIHAGDYLSHRSIHRGDGLTAENSHHYPAADAIVFDQYAFEKCGNYRNPLDKSVLKYQLEYLLFGEETDEQNLEKTVNTLFLIRLAANLAFLLTDGARTAEAETWAGVISALLFSPELEPVIKTALLLAWTYTETLQDLKTLMVGGSIPLVKSGGNWKTRLRDIFAPDRSTRGETGGSGLNYEAYLRILLYLENGSRKNYRLMDLMEMDIRRTKGNEAFRMDWCLDTFRLEAEASSSFGYSYTIEREVTYN